MRKLMGWPAFILLAMLAQAWNIQQAYQRDPEGYLFGDSGFYAAAAHSMLYDGDLDLLNQCFPGRETLDAALTELEGPHGQEFALSKQRSVTLKQSPLLSIAAMPFYAIMGKGGLLIFNLMMLNVMLILMAILGGASSAARLTILVGFVTTPLWMYAFNFSPDIFLCVLILGSILSAQQCRPALSGLLAGLAVSTKIYVAAILLPLPLIVWAAHDLSKFRALGKLVFGGIVGMVPGAILNVWQFGDPLTNGYGRQLEVHDGIISLGDHVSLFNVPLSQGLHNIFLDESLGLLWTAPLWFAWPIALASLVRSNTSQRKAETLALGLMILATLALFIPYAGWNATVHGNRYLFPAVTVGFVIIARAMHLWFATGMQDIPYSPTATQEDL